MDRERNTTKKSIPEEIVEEILVRLRVKSLLRFKCVSKSWLSLIDSKRFIKAHLQYSTKNTDSAHHRVIIMHFNDRETKQCSLRTLLEEPVVTDLSPLRHPISPASTLSAFCNGMVCVQLYGRFRLLNPSTRVSNELPEDPEIDIRQIGLALLKVGFGWDELSGAYVVFAGWCTLLNRPSVWHRNRVYNSKTNSWKRVQESPDITISSPEVGQLVGGKLHWLRETINFTPSISSFDLKTEAFGTIELPVGLNCKGRLLLRVVGGCLCLSTDDYCDDPKKAFDVWVMKEYGVRESWQKLATIPLVDEPQYDYIGQFYARIVGEAPNGDILIAYGTSLLVYCPRNGVIRHRAEIGSFYEPCLYIESLV